MKPPLVASHFGSGGWQNQKSSPPFVTLHISFVGEFEDNLMFSLPMRSYFSVRSDDIRRCMTPTIRSATSL